MLCYTLQRAVAELSFLANPHQPNGYDNKIALVDPLKGYKSDTPATHRHPWHGPGYGPTHHHDHNHDHSPDSHSLSSHGTDLGPSAFYTFGLLQHYLAK